MQASRDFTSISTFTPKVFGAPELSSGVYCIGTRATEQELRTFERRFCANGVQENCLRAPRPSSRLGGNRTPSGLIRRYELHIVLQDKQLHNFSNLVTHVKNFILVWKNISSLLDHTNSNAKTCKTSKFPAYCICHYQECSLDLP